MARTNDAVDTRENPSATGENTVAVAEIDPAVVASFRSSDMGTYDAGNPLQLFDSAALKAGDDPSLKAGTTDLASADTTLTGGDAVRTNVDGTPIVNPEGDDKRVDPGKVEPTAAAIDEVPPVVPDEVSAVVPEEVKAVVPDEVKAVVPDEVPAVVPEEVKAVTPGEATAAVPADAAAPGTTVTNQQFLEDAKVRRGEGPYQVASRLLGSDGQPVSQADVKALTTALKDAYAAQREGDPNLPGLNGLKQRHEFVNQNNIDSVIKSLRDSGNNALADRLAANATKGGDNPAAAATATDGKSNTAQVAAQVFENLNKVQNESQLNRYIAGFGQNLATTFAEGSTHPFAADVTAKSIIDALNQKMQEGTNPVLKDRELYFQNNELRIRKRTGQSTPGVVATA